MKKRLFLVLPVFLVLGLVLLIWSCFAPGFMSYDSVVQYQSALDQRYADSHPPIMSYVWHLCMLLVSGPQALLYFHLTLMALGIFLWQGSFKSILWRLLTPALFVLPWIINFTGVLWKDVGMAFSLLVATGLLFNRSKSFRLVFLAVPFIFYALGVRHNAILAIVPVLFFAFSYHFPKFSIWQSGLATVLLTVVLSGSVSVVTYSFIHAEKKHYETFLMGDEIAKISYETHQNLLPGIKEEDLQVCGVPPILYERALCFISKGYDPSGSLVVNIPVEVTYSLWEKTILSNPMAYASVRIEAFLYFLRSPRLEPGFPWFPGVMKNDLDVQLQHPQMAGLLEKYVMASQSTLLGELFKPYFWLILAILIIILASKIRASLEKTQILVLNFSALGYFFSLLIAVPSIDFRYVYWCVIASSLSLVIFASTLQYRHESNQ